MKKVLAAALTMALSAGMTMGVLAEDETEMTITGAQTANVTATYNAGNKASTIYKIDISWGSMSFTYNEASKGTWDPDDHVYKDVVTAGWSWDNNANVIEVTNHSNAGINVTPSYTAATGYEAVTMGFSSASLLVDSADNGKGTNGAGTAETGTISVTPSGTLPEMESTAQIGTITLTIQEDDGMKYHVGDTVTHNQSAMVVYSVTKDTASLITKNAMTIPLSGINDVLKYFGMATADIMQEAYDAELITLDKDTTYFTANGSYYKLNEEGQLVRTTDQSSNYIAFLTASIDNSKTN